MRITAPIRRGVLAGSLLLAAAGAAQPTPLVAQQSEDAAAAAWAAGDLLRARELYAARVHADSADVQALHRLGLLLGWNRDFNGSIPLLRRLIDVAPSPAARLDLARVLSWSGDFDAADVVYRSLLEDRPGDVDALRGRAQVASWRGDHDRADRLYRELLATAPDDVLAHVGLSQVLRWRGRSRDALDHAETAARLEPENGAVLEALAWAEAAFRPRFASTLAGESDSDHNTLLTGVITAAANPARRVGVEARVQLRRAASTLTYAPHVVRETRAAALGARVELGSGWIAALSGGVAERSADRDGTLATYAASLATPAWRRVVVTGTHAHALLDFTADLMGRDVTTGESALSLAIRISPALRIEGGAAVTRFHGVSDNRRELVRAAVEASAARGVRLRPRVAAFRFAESTHEGYFAPDQYWLGEVGLGIEQWRSGWSLSGEVAPGAQRIGSAGDVQGALSARLRVGYTLAPGRDVALSLSGSNLGIQRLEAGSAGYRHQALSLSASWGL